MYWLFLQKKTEDNIRSPCWGARLTKDFYHLVVLRQHLPSFSTISRKSDEFVMNRLNRHLIAEQLLYHRFLQRMLL